MKLRRLMIIPFICLVSCGSAKNNVISHCAYQHFTTHNRVEYIVFNKDKTEFIYNETLHFKCWFKKNNKIYGTPINNDLDMYIGYVEKDFHYIQIETDNKSFVQGQYKVNLETDYGGLFDYE